MKKGTLLMAFVSIVFAFSCKDPKPDIHIPEPRKTAYASDTLELEPDLYYDKVLGALVGSAIGDAMGTSTEMWDRKDIRRKYGYITGITPATRTQSPEGPWENNLAAGTTTDDTRWKFLMTRYLQQHHKNLKGPHFARFISEYYRTVASQLGNREVLASPDSLDARIEKVDWIKEWARVALAFQTGTQAYLEARNRFYGGEMSCAGMLYTPVFGLIAETPDGAYLTAYDHTLFDLGYAKDIASQLASMTHMALRTTDMDSILNAAIFVDPLRYEDSRLVGRISGKIVKEARKGVWLAREIEISDSIPIDSVAVKDVLSLKVPKEFPGTPTDWKQQQFVYDLLAEDERAIAFHAAEIWQILITSLEFGEGDFDKTLQFITNYGRDNDTVGAIAGMILGARVGYSKLPLSLKEEVLKTNREQLGIDLELLAQNIADLKQ